MEEVLRKNHYSVISFKQYAYKIYLWNIHRDYYRQYFLDYILKMSWKDDEYLAFRKNASTNLVKWLFNSSSFSGI